MPPRRRNRTLTPRAGARPSQLTPALRDALRAETERIAALPEHEDRAKAVGDLFAAIDTELEKIALVRIRAVAALKRGGMSQDTIGKTVGLSRPRVGQLLADPRFER